MFDTQRVFVVGISASTGRAAAAGNFPPQNLKKSLFVILRMDVCKLTHHYNDII